MEGNPFLDTNILLYAFSLDPRSEIAERLLEMPFEISVQVLNEFANVMRKKFKAEWEPLETVVADIVQLARVIHPITLDVHVRGLRIAESYQLQTYDAVLIASALKARCAILWSEDMQDGMVIENRLTIRNPFA
jgi:predicted nucleic acid-binding protein